MKTILYSTDEERYSDDTPEEAAFEYEGSDEIFTVYCGELIPIKVNDLSPKLNYVTEFIEDEFYGMIANAPEYLAIDAAKANAFEAELNKLIEKYWNKPPCGRIKKIWEKQMRWEGDKVVEVK